MSTNWGADHVVNVVNFYVSEHTKGKVERAVRFVKENFLPNRRFTTLDDLNVRARAWCDKVNRRIHGTTGERPVDRLKDEPLKQLVGPEKLTSFLSEERKVDSDGYFSFDRVRYGVPWHYGGSTVRVRTVAGQVEAWLGTSGLLHMNARTLGVVCSIYITSTRECRRMTPHAGIHIQDVDVEYRPLSVYDS